MKYRRPIVLLIIVALFTVGAGCGGEETPTPTPASPPTTTATPEVEVIATPTGEPYPAPSPTSSEPTVYPPPATATFVVESQAYPEPRDTPTAQRECLALSLDLPLREGDSEISGEGPPGAPVLIVDVTFMGSILAGGPVGEDGTFSFEVDSLEADHRVGVMVGDTEGTEWNEGDFCRGERYMNLPLIGAVYDSDMVQP